MDHVTRPVPASGAGSQTPLLTASERYEKADAGYSVTMRHRLKERPKPAANNVRRKARRTRAALSEGVSLQAAITSDWSAPCETLISELDELLTVDEDSGWWKEDERPEDTSLTDLLQHLVDCEDDEDDDDIKVEAATIPIMAATHPTNKMAAAHNTIGDINASQPSNKMADSLSATGDKISSRKRSPGNKNALAARLNRLRKKEYVSGLEGRVARLVGENQRLEHERRLLGARVRELEEESRYLRAVLTNDSALSQLLGRLTGLGGVRLSTSLFRSQPKLEDHDYALPGLGKIRHQEEQEEGSPPGGGGVCLHVDKEKVSVEFCPACARSASSSTKM